MDSSPVFDDKMVYQLLLGLYLLMVGTVGLVIGLIALFRPSWLRQELKAQEGKRDEKVNSVNADPFRPLPMTCTQGKSFFDAYHPQPTPSLNSFSDSYQAHTPFPSIRQKQKFPNTFSGTDSDLQDYLIHFEIISKLNGWSEAEKGSYLALSLQGNAQQLLRDLPAEKVENYQSIVEILKRRFDPDEREILWRIEFRKRLKMQNESVTEYGFVLKRLANSAYPRMPHSAIEALTIDQFIDGLPSYELKKHVQFGHPTTLNQAIALATELDSFERGFKDSTLSESSMKAEEKTEGESKILQILEELAMGLKNISDQLTKDGENSQTLSLCTYCDDEHLSQNCPFFYKRCHTCRKRGHISENCRKGQ